MNKTFEVIFVNDCSKDNSYKVLKNIHEKNQDVIVIDLMKNYGQQNALMCGFNYCKGKYIITLDDDLQNPPEEIPKLYQKIIDGYDVVLGTYQIKHHNPYKNIGSYIVRKLNNRIFSTENKIKFSSFRILKKSIIDEIKFMRTPFPYISGMILSVTSSIANVEIDHFPRKHGESHYNFKKLINLSFNLLINYSSIPLRFIGALGLIVSLLSFSLGCSYILRKLGGKGSGQIAMSIFEEVNKITQEWEIEGYLNDIVKVGEFFSKYKVLGTSDEVIDFVNRGYYIHYTLHFNAKNKYKRANKFKSFNIPLEAHANPTLG